MIYEKCINKKKVVCCNFPEMKKMRKIKTRTKFMAFVSWPLILDSYEFSKTK